MVEQTYQEVSKIMIEDLKRLKKQKGIETLGGFDYQRYFFYKKQQHPEKYERLIFDTNGAEPFSNDIERILYDFRVCEILYNKIDILPGE